MLSQHTVRCAVRSTIRTHGGRPIRWCRETRVRPSSSSSSFLTAPRRGAGAGAWVLGTSVIMSTAAALAVVQHSSSSCCQTEAATTKAEESGGSDGSMIATPGDPWQEIKDAVAGWWEESEEEEEEEATEEVEEDTTTTTTITTPTQKEPEGVSNQIGGTVPPGKKVVVELDPELVEELPYMSLEEVQACNGLPGRRRRSQQHQDEDDQERLLVSYDGIVYDVTEFANAHPGGRGLLMTAAGLDLQHFFDNYTVHGASHKAAQWLAPLAVGKLSTDDCLRARADTNAHTHVTRRHQLLSRTRRKMLLVAASLPLWMTLRQMITWIGTVVSPTLATWLARRLPVTVPGYSPGAEPVARGGTVAVIGGGIAGCGAAWALAEDGMEVTLYEAREHVSGNARTFEWDFSPFRSNSGSIDEPEMDSDVVRSCVSVTAWPPVFYKNYTCLLERLGVETVHQPLSWFLNSKVPGYEGTLWAADPTVYEGSLRRVFARDFELYGRVEAFSRRMVNFFTLRWAPWRKHDTPSMYDSHQGFGLLNPLNVVPLYSLYKLIGGSDEWWNIVFTPHYTASFLVDELRPFPAVFGPLIEAQIPLNPILNVNTWKGSSPIRGDTDVNITTCVTWKDAGRGLRCVFDQLVANITLRERTRVLRVEVLPDGRKRVHDEYDGSIVVDRVIFACPCNAVGNIHADHGALEEILLSTPVYADDHHPDSGHMHAVMHSDGSVVDANVREDVLRRASNYVEVTGTLDQLNIENQYNFGVQTPGPGVYDLPLHKKPVMLISHSLGEGKTIDPALVRGTGNHARAHPLYSGWNVMAQLSMRLVQGRDGIYYCSNWTTPGNCHDMSLLSGFVCAHAVGAKYPFEENVEAKKDFERLRDLMGF